MFDVIHQQLCILLCNPYLILCYLFIFYPFFFSGGYYADTRAFVRGGCKECERGTYVHYDKAPGQNRYDCKACPRGDYLKLSPHHIV